MTTTATSFAGWDRLVTANTTADGMVQSRHPANGSGRYIDCPTCDGTGRVWQSNDDDEDDGDGVTTAPSDRTRRGQLERRSAKDAVARREWFKPSTAQAYTEYADASLPEMYKRDRVREAGPLSYRAVVRLLAKRQGIDPDDPAQFVEDRDASEGQVTTHGRVIVPPPVTPTSAIIAIHELQHRAVGWPKGVPEWLLELRVWERALVEYEGYHLPEYRQAAHAPHGG
jgi:hypothetical protein